MSDKAFNDRDEVLFDAMLKAATIESITEEINGLPSEVDLSKMNLRSETFNKRISTMIGRHDKIRKRKSASKLAYKLVATFALVFTVGTITLMSVEASRVFILNRFISIIQDDHVIFEFGQEQSRIKIDSDKSFTTIDGFEMANAIEMENVSIYVYSNGFDEQIILEINHGTDVKAFMDLELREFVTISINEHPAFVLNVLETSEDDLENIIVWGNEQNVISIISPIEIERLLSIAEVLIEKAP